MPVDPQRLVELYEARRERKLKAISYPLQRVIDHTETELTEAKGEVTWEVGAEDPRDVTIHFRPAIDPSLASDINHAISDGHRDLLEQELSRHYLEAGFDGLTIEEGPDHPSVVLDLAIGPAAEEKRAKRARLLG